MWIVNNFFTLMEQPSPFVIEACCHTSNVKNGYKAQQPRIKYNEEILAVKKDECPICLEDMDMGNLIARLPCLCIFHKSCIDEWFLRKNTCPCHPDD
uniref:RING-type E3 ubiquitin transferase n=1 Tax=Meloidogyne incognita TaxID=6306 RepID=A0A914LNC0_MELIC